MDSRNNMADKIKPGIGDALIIIDVQNDFLPGGSLAVAHGDEVVPVLNRYIQIYRNYDDGMMMRDVVTLEDELQSGEPLLMPVMRAGKR